MIEPVNNRARSLEEVSNIVNGSRVDMYGTPEKSFDTIAKYWSAYLRKELSPCDVAIMMVLLKVARQSEKPKHDNLIDIAGYAICATDLEEDDLK